MGIQPDILVLRTERHLDDALRMKVASFCNVDLECVVQSEDMPSIYEVPVNMQQQGLDAAILKKTAKAPPSAPEGATIDHTPDSKTIEAPSGDERGALKSTLSLAFIQPRLPRMVLISPLWANKRKGWASDHVGNVFVLNRECTSASPLVK